MEESKNQYGDPTPASQAIQPKKRSRLRLVLKLLGIIGLLVIVLIALAPTILSTGAVQHIIFGQVNSRLNGKVEASSLSLGWFSGVKLTGVRVTDAAGAQIAELDHLTVPFPLWKAITGNFALGEIPVDGLSIDAKYDTQGRLNFSQLVKTQSASPPTAGAPATTASATSKLPNISGNLKLTHIRGTISKPGVPTLFLTQLDGEVKIPDINQPISDNFTASLKVGNDPEGIIKLTGTAAMIKQNQIAIDSGEVHQKLSATNLNLQSLKPFLPASISTLDGIISLDAAADLTNGKNAGVDLLLTSSTPVSIGGSILQGDTITTNKLNVQIPNATASFPDGTDHWQTGRIKAAKPLVVKIDQGQVTVAADLTPQSLLNVLDNKAPGSAGTLSLSSNFDLARIISQLKHAIPLQVGTQVDSGTFTENVSLVMTSETAVLTQDTTTTPIIGSRAAVGGQSEKVQIDPIHITVDATDVGGGKALPDLQKMNMRITSKAANGEFHGQTLADLNGALNIDLNLLRDELSQFVDLKDTTLAGAVSVNVTEQGQLTQAPFKGNAKLTVTSSALKYSDSTGRKVDQRLVLLEMATDLQGSAQHTVEKINSLALSLKTGSVDSKPIVSATVTDATISSAATSVLNQLQSAHWQLDVPSLKSVMDLANQFSAPVVQPTPVAKPDQSAPKPLPPLQITGGQIALAGDLSHDGSTMKISVGRCDLQNAAFHRGDVSYALKPISITAGISLQTGGGKSVIEQIHQAEVTQLIGNLGIATLSMPTPIIITKLATTPVANGSIKVDGNLTDLTELLAAVQGQKPDTLPYHGNYTATQTIISQQNSIGLKGALQIANFQSFNGKTVTFSEDLFAITNDVNLTTVGSDESVVINDLSASMQSSGAVHLTLKNGSVGNLLTQRTLQLQPTLEYDLAKLWPIIQPMMGDQYKTLKITGQFKKQFNVTGSYPTNHPPGAAIKTLHADGDLAVATFDYNGLSVQNLVLPFMLDNGKVTTVYANKPDDQNTAPPATANGGQLDLSNITADLTQDVPRLNIPPNKKLISNMTINQLFAKTYLAEIVDNPILAGADQTTGGFDLMAVHCVDLPMSNLVTQGIAANTGRCDLKFSLTNLNVGLKGISALGSIMKQESFTANVKDGTVSVAKGISTQNISFVSGKYALTFSGKVRLADETLMPLNLSMGPIAAVVEQSGIHDPNVLKFLPDQITFPVEGTVHKPRFRTDLFAKAIADAELKGAAGSLLNGNKGGDNSNPLGGLLNQLGKKKK